ncbi:MAG: hypothetical protein ACAI44_36530 [Candidatus Sericytochromatia bacterium]
MNGFKALVYFVSFVFFSWIYGVLIGGNLTQLVPYASAGLYLVAGLVLGLMNFKASEIAAAFRDAMQGCTGTDASGRYVLAARIFYSMGLYPIVAGAGATLVHTWWVLYNLEMPEFTTGMALALLPLWIGLGFRFFVVYPFEIALEKQAGSLSAEAL